MCLIDVRPHPASTGGGEMVTTVICLLFFFVYMECCTLHFGTTFCSCPSSGWVNILFTSLLLPFGEAVWGWLLTCFHRLSGQTHQ